MKEDNKNVQLLKEELWTRKTTVEIMMLKRTTIINNLGIKEDIKKNSIREQEVIQALEKEDGLS